MRYRGLGDSGLVVSVAGLGTNNFGYRLDLDQCREVLWAALDLGVTLVDTSDSYGDAEEKIGALLAGGRRDDVVLATKFGDRSKGPQGPGWEARGSRRYVRRAVEASLRRLRTDWIDLYQYHRPDPYTPIGETLSVLSDLVSEGKIRYIGHSNFTGWQVADADWTARTAGHPRFVSAQNRYNLLERRAEDEVLPAVLRYGLGLLPYFPLASGILSGKYRRGEPVPAGSRLQAWGIESRLTDEVFTILERLEAFGAERSLPLVDVAMGAVAARPGVASVIAGAMTPDQLRSNVRGALWEPTPDDVAAIDQITGG